eukprot:4280191-Pleurochrysis_carterae.AAC.1
MNFPACARVHAHVQALARMLAYFQKKPASAQGKRTHQLPASEPAQADAVRAGREQCNANTRT